MSQGWVRGPQRLATLPPALIQDPRAIPDLPLRRGCVWCIKREKLESRGGEQEGDGEEIGLASPTVRPTTELIIPAPTCPRGPTCCVPICA